MLSYEDSSSTKDILFYEKGIDWIQGEHILRDGHTEIIPYNRTVPLEKELKYFIEHLNGDVVEIAGAQNAIDVLEILEKATESLLSGTEVKTKGFLTSSIIDLSLKFFVHYTAEIDENVTIGKDTKIWHFSHIVSGSNIGDYCNIGQNVVIGPDVIIGKGCKIQNNVSVYKGVILEDGVFCGPSMVFTNIYNPRAEICKMDQVRPTLVKKGATIGANAIVICGITLGQYCFIGAGAVVTKNVPDHALVVGNPAR